MILTQNRAHPSPNPIIPMTLRRNAARYKEAAIPIELSLLLAESALLSPPTHISFLSLYPQEYIAHKTKLSPLPTPPHLALCVTLITLSQTAETKWHGIAWHPHRVRRGRGKRKRKKERNSSWVDIRPSSSDPKWF